MNHSFVLQGSKIQLINQLIYFDEAKKQFMDQYFPENNQKRKEVEKVLSDYTKTLEKILANFNEESLHSYVLIGSKLKLSYLDDNSTGTYTIVFPHKANLEENKVSFLSPLVFQLLLSQPNKTYQLDLPLGETSVHLKEVKFVNSGTIE